jgi:hypothetical protein
LYCSNEVTLKPTLWTQTKQRQPIFKNLGDWIEQSKQLKEKFSTLTDHDLKLEEGKERKCWKESETD